MDALGFRPCQECGKRALIELADGNGRICARCYVRRRRANAAASDVASRTLAYSAGPTRVRSSVTRHDARKG